RRSFRSLQQMPDGSDDVSMQVRCERLGGTHVEAKSRVVNRRIRGEPFTNQQRHKLSRIQKIQSIWSDRKSAKQMPRQSERASELPLLLLRQVGGISASRLTPH